MQQRLIFHVDVNSAFLSWEAARRVAAGEPDLRAIPSAIGGDRDKRTGIILAKSIPAKKFGVTTGEPVGMALRKCPQLVLAPPDFALYTRNSRAFIAICRRFAPVVEQVSIDECFLDMTGTHLLYPDPLLVAHQIKDAIFSKLGFTVNVGISENKLLAKMASDFEKPDKVHTLFPARDPAEALAAARWRPALRRPRPCRKAHRGPHPHDRRSGPDGPRLPAEAHRRPHRRPPARLRLRRRPLPRPRRARGRQMLRQLHHPRAGRHPPTVPQANQVLLALCDSVAARLRADGRRCLCLTVTIRGSDFKNRSHQRRLPEPSDVTQELYDCAKSLFAEFWDGRPLRLLGVTLSDLTDGQTQQLSLFPDEKRDRARKLDQAVDQLRGKFGPAAISRGPLTPTTHRLHRKFTPNPPDP